MATPSHSPGLSSAGAEAAWRVLVTTSLGTNLLVVHKASASIQALQGACFL